MIKNSQTVGSNHRILLPQPILKQGREYLLSRGYELIDGTGVEEEDILREIGGCEGMIVRTARITSRIIQSADCLRVIARHGAGYDGVDISAARTRNILVLNAPGANSMSVAELAIFYMLYCSRNFKLVQKTYIEDYSYAKFKTQKSELHGKTLGLVGLGNIGALVAEKAALGFGMSVIAYDPYAKKALPDYIRLTENRDAVFCSSDYISLHAPATKDTINSIGEQEFDLMKKTAFLINTARGSIVDETALIEALKTGKIAGAALDVLKSEPFDKKNPLLYLDNVVTAPHIGAATAEASARTSLFCAIGMDDFFSGKTPEYIIPEMRDMVNR